MRGNLGYMPLLAKDRLRRYRCVFPSTNEARNFYDAIGYVSRKEPAESWQIGTSFDGRTVLVYARTSRWTRAGLAREAKIRHGHIASASDVYR
jgi:hypothetical protein